MTEILSLRYMMKGKTEEISYGTLLPPRVQMSTQTSK